MVSTKTKAASIKTVATWAIRAPCTDKSKMDINTSVFILQHGRGFLKLHVDLSIVDCGLETITFCEWHTMNTIPKAVGHWTALGGAMKWWGSLIFTLDSYVSLYREEVKGYLRNILRFIIVYEYPAHKWLFPSSRILTFIWVEFIIFKKTTERKTVVTIHFLLSCRISKINKKK